MGYAVKKHQLVQRIPIRKFIRTLPFERRKLPDARRRIIPITASVSHDASGSEAIFAANTSSQSYTGLTVVSNTNGAIVVSFVINDIATSISTVTGYTFLVAFTGTTWRVELWGKVGNTAGLQTIAFTCNNATATGVFISAVSVTGANQTGGTTTFNHTNTASGNSANSSITITTASTDLAVSNLAINNEVSNLNHTVIYSDNGSTPSNFAAYDQNDASSPATFSSVGGITASEWEAAAVNIAAVGSGTITEEDNSKVTGRSYPQKWTPKQQFLQNYAQDQSSFGVETNPHWRGRVWPLPWAPQRSLMQNAALDVPPTAQPETNTFYKPKTWSLQWSPMPFGRTTAQDFSSFGVETNPHWSGRIWSLPWAPISLMRAIPLDVPFTPPDVPIYFQARMQPVVWTPLRALARLAALDVTPPAVETNINFVPRQWPMRWDLQRSLLRGVPQDFTTLPPTSQPVYARYGAAHGIGMLSAIPGEIPS